jgi:DNA-binding beta-propeller fold protein YncE
VTFFVAGVNSPNGLAFDASGNLYVTNGNNTISEVTPGGIVSTFVDSNQGLNYPFALAFDASGNLYVANAGNNTISEVTPGGVVSTFVDSTQGLNDPLALAFDAGNLYVANAISNTISEVTPSGVVSSDEMTGIQALERNAPSRPMTFGSARKSSSSTRGTGR